MNGTIGILTGGGDVPGLNPAIRALTLRALGEGYRIIGIRKGWEGLININPDLPLEEQTECEVLTPDRVNRIAHTGGTFLHTSRTLPSKVSSKNVPDHLRDRYTEARNDLTPTVLKNLEYLGIDTLIPIGGDDTLSYAVRLLKEGVNIVAIPKTMDNDVPGTDYCIGYSTCVTRIIELCQRLRTTAGSHERIMIVEVFGRYAGFTALLPTMAGAAGRCVIPEYKFNIERLAELLVEDRSKNPSKYASVLVSEGATFEGGEMVFESQEADAYGHKKLGGIGDQVAEQLKALLPKINQGNPIGLLNQRLGYLVRSGEPDSLDSIVPMVFSNLAVDLILKKKSGRLISLRNGRYCDVDLEVVTAHKKVVNIGKYYNPDRLCPRYRNFDGLPAFIITSENY